MSEQAANIETLVSTGDLMGRAMKNLDKLLAMPYGCGEQNMILFAPNIFILNYLKSTGQLTKEIQDKATHFLESGEFVKGAVHPKLLITSSMQSEPDGHVLWTSS